MLLVIGLVLCAAGFVLLLNVGGAAEAVIHRVTSHSLGELAPGYAGTRRGFNVYATLVLAVGLFTLGLAVIAWDIPIGTSLIVLGGISFAGASVIAIAGEIETYRALKR
jgi:hypothetical protein